MYIYLCDTGHHDLFQNRIAKNYKSIGSTGSGGAGGGGGGGGGADPMPGGKRKGYVRYAMYI